MDLDWKLFERAESLAVLGLSLFAYYRLLSGDFVLFVALALLPDVSMAGYLRDDETGALIYNAAHNYLGPGVVIAYGLLTGDMLFAEIGFIWSAHIAADRVLGFGLKKKSGFKHTHLSE